MESKERNAIVGWNWGYYTLEDDQFRFDVKGTKAFGMSYADIKLASATGKDEIAIELDRDQVAEE